MLLSRKVTFKYVCLCRFRVFLVSFQNFAISKLDFCIAVIYITLTLWTAEKDKYATYTCHFITAQLKNCIIRTTLLCNKIIL